ncbi:biliverdin-producing heme oxygenase [Pantoea sp. 18069]|uniref:biliverdin-producing heme oxygenase n=1 Tax=Pantoea sp. 18069 TaxID=2681415 RepID=UPI0013578E5E|nr:biliverdin-producing heme oxygenase [Pantoea sp. 18069]
MTSLSPDDSRRQRLKLATRDVHGGLDQRIMAAEPFASRERYGAFLRTQYCLHRDAEALFADPQLNGLLPGLRARSRLALIAQDLKDLDVALDTAPLPAPVFTAGAEVAHIPVALGWLYTIEGSNIGAAFLLKAAAALGLGVGFGARHLAPQADSRAAHWRGFIAQLDAVQLPAADEGGVDEGARAAFTAARGHVERFLPVPA